MMENIEPPENKLQKLDFGLSRTSGFSMRPLIWGGHHHVVSVPITDEPKIGDLLIFEKAYNNGVNTSIVHRLVEIQDDGINRLYITRGDNNIGNETVTRSEIIGKVTEIHRMTGFRPWYILPFKKISVTDPLYLTYTRCWQAIWPARKIIYLIRAHALNLRNRLFSPFNKKTKSPKQKR